MADREKLLDRCREIALLAGEAIEKVRGRDVEVSSKRDGSPVTEADRASHESIVSRLARLTPEIPIVSEESSGERPTGISGAFWLVDPLDGTKEFVKGLDEYTVNIALVQEGLPVLGVIYAPALDLTYYAARGAGAWRQEGGSREVPISPAEKEGPQTAVVSRSHLSVETEEFLAGLGVEELVRRGSSLKMCSVAEGTADIYPRFGPTYLWDTAAGAAVARGAGCTLVDRKGGAVSYELAGDLRLGGFVLYAPGGVAARVEQYMQGAGSR